MRSCGIVILLFLYLNSSAQDDRFRTKFINSVSNVILSSYYSKERATRMVDSIKTKFKEGGYDSLLWDDEFAFEVSRDLRRMSGDLHFNLVPPHPRAKRDSIILKASEGWSAKKRDKFIRKKRRSWAKFEKTFKERTSEDMFDYGEIKILPGNIGFVEIRDFGNTSYIKKQNKGRIRLSSVISFLKNTDALIIDLRNNQGGAVIQAAYFCSFFSKKFADYFITTNDVYRWDSSGTEKEYRSMKRIYTANNFNATYEQNKKLYLLCSKKTFSAAVIVMYKLKGYFKAVTIVGEPTPGSGYAHVGYDFAENFEGVIPTSKITDEFYGRDFSEKGIEPDLVVPADSAFNVAYRVATQSMRKISGRTRYYSKSEKPSVVDQKLDELYRKYEGDFRKVQVVFKDGKLLMVYDFFTTYNLQPVSEYHFITPGFESISFSRNEAGEITGINIKMPDGYTEKFRKVAGLPNPESPF